MKEIREVIEVMVVGGGGEEGVGEGSVGMERNVGVDGKVGVIGFVGVMDVGMGLVVFVVGRGGWVNDGGMEESGLGDDEGWLGEGGIDGVEELRGELMVVEEVGEIDDGGGMGEGGMEG